jgi:Ca2+-binding RTX toxin-like protein
VIAKSSNGDVLTVSYDLSMETCDCDSPNYILTESISIFDESGRAYLHDIFIIDHRDEYRNELLSTPIHAVALFDNRFFVYYSLFDIKGFFLSVDGSRSASVMIEPGPLLNSQHLFPWEPFVVATLGGGFFATWNNGEYYYGQHFDSSGSAVETAFVISTIALTETHALIARPDGSMVLIYQTRNLDESYQEHFGDIEFKIIAYDGNVSPASFLTHSSGGYDNNIGMQEFAAPTAIALGLGKTLVVYRTHNLDHGDPARVEIVGRVITSSDLIENVFQITSGVNEYYPNLNIILLPDGRFFASWLTSASTDANSTFLGQLFFDDGRHDGDQITIGVTDNYLPIISLSPDGQIRFAWGNHAQYIETRTTAINYGGSDGDDSIVGTGFDDTLAGGVGDDHITGGAGDDYIDGGTGHDTASYDAAIGGIVAIIFAGAGTIYGDAHVGTDQVFSIERLIAGSGNDVLYADNRSELDGGSGFDYLVELSQGIIMHLGANTTQHIEFVILAGGANTLDVVDVSRHWVQGTAGDDTISLGSGGGYVWGGSGTNILHGGSGQTVFIGDVNGASVMHGHSRNDVFYVTTHDTVDAVAGYNYLIYLESAAFGTLVPQNIDFVIGSNGADYINALPTRSAMTISGLAGDDYLSGGTGNDTLYGGNGDDRLIGGGGNDVIDGGAGDDVLHGFDGANTFVFSSGWGNDVIDHWWSGTGNKLDMTALAADGVHAIADVSIAVLGHDCVVTLGADTITILNHEGGLTADDFQFR